MRLARLSQGRFAVQDAGALVRFRQRADRAANLFMRPPRQVRIESGKPGAVAGDWIIPGDAPEDPVLLFYHGGGIVFGWNNPLRRELAYLARFAGLRAFGVDYHLIPEYTYPTAHDECYAVYRSLLEQGRRIILMGESSGGVLALATMLRAKKDRLPQPLLCALISPAVDYDFRNERIWQSKDAFAHPNFTRELHRHYVAGHDTSLPDLAPIYADLRGIAPLLVLAGEDEILRCETDRLAEAARRFHVPVETIFWPAVWHSWHGLVPQLPEAKQALQALARAICQQVEDRCWLQTGPAQGELHSHQ